MGIKLSSGNAANNAPSSLLISGEGGDGFIDLIPQEPSPDQPSSSVRLYVDQDGGLTWANTSGVVSHLFSPAVPGDHFFLLPNTTQQSTLVVEGANPTLQDNTYTWVGTTPPLTRPNAAALVDGDIFIEKNVRRWQYRNPLWLSEPYLVGFGFNNSGGSSSTIAPVQSGLIFMRKLSVIPNTSWNYSVPNYWSIDLKMWQSGGTIGNNDISYLLDLTGSYSSRTEIDINTAADHYGSGATNGAFAGIRVGLTKFGALGNFSASFVLEYSLIRS